MKTLSVLIKRNTKLFFKDKGLFFTSMITQVIFWVETYLYPVTDTPLEFE